MVNERDEMKRLMTLMETSSEGREVFEGYWEGNGRHQDKATELQKLIPNSGKTETMAGELWRAATKIYYDYNNNGFGNDWKAPAAFLMQNIKLSQDVTDMFLEYADGIIDNNFGSQEKATEKMMDEVIEWIHKYPELHDLPTKDMWDTDSSGYDWQEDDSDFFQDEEEDEYEYQWDDDDE